MKVSVSRRAHFNAAHRLNNPNWSPAKNAEVFGKCNLPNYHGHNYVLIVTIRGEIDPDTGFVMNLKDLSDLIKGKVTERFDHKNLNIDTEEFKNLNPTVENISVVIWNILRKHIPAKHGLKITPMQLATACDGWTSRLSVTMLCERIAHPGCWSHVARLGNRTGPAGGARPDLSKTTGTPRPSVRDFTTSTKSSSR